MIELPPLTARSQASIVFGVKENNDKKVESTLLVRMNGYRQTSNLDSSASSTSKSHSSGGLLIKRSKTTNNLNAADTGRLGTLFEQKKFTPPSRHISRTTSTQKFSNRSEHGSITTGNGSNLQGSSFGNKTLTPQRCVSSNDLTNLDGNNNHNLTRRGPLYRHKSDQRINEIKPRINNGDTAEEKLSGRNNERRESRSSEYIEKEEESDSAREERILAWLQNVEKYAEPPPDVPSDDNKDDTPPQTDTAIHVVYKGTT